MGGLALCRPLCHHAIPAADLVSSVLNSPTSATFASVSPQIVELSPTFER